MANERLTRFAPLSGVLFLVLMIVWFALTGEPADFEDSAEKIVGHWADDDAKIMIGSAIAAIGAAALVWFGGSLRVALHAAEGPPGRLASVAFAGTVVMAVGLLFFAGVEFSAADSAGDVPAEVTQTLTVMDSDMFFLVAAGVFLMQMATALVILRTGVLARWLGWVSVVISIAALTPGGFFATLASFLWVGLVGILIYRGAAEAPAAPAPAA